MCFVGVLDAFAEEVVLTDEIVAQAKVACMKKNFEGSDEAIRASRLSCMQGIEIEAMKQRQKADAKKLEAFMKQPKEEKTAESPAPAVTAAGPAPECASTRSETHVRGSSIHHSEQLMAWQRHGNAEMTAFYIEIVNLNSR